uniref:non-specific serine/threonine protein kinase n=1 Tax=Mucochytrium quahogii TaxID=96639 RepID=A0A7S2RB93_9STRA|mmetsp:Transcript_11177/g.20775  ORF Transcript_11177/g.20775 Transcript_11177/m.20775 type:complete len:3064 (+) Transcript_11177:227-9418(+)|eukprot:CAMPEP_0203750044 /NCGR_PEP_ID=MMETSP0098-20131031/4351_1 /ASSEMBLY_ACC=CAM_ASM_000208 /TAXON_ID=96639 /ORGANISM=" , Strain NY0313808BC1" /LENGTH=3063 /DNA_ID=CAMNT_0050639175 /DNA_START=136 /DNA_END=9327 /DNA_ORIENTATION=-
MKNTKQFQLLLQDLQQDAVTKRKDALKKVTEFLNDPLFCDAMHVGNLTNSEQTKWGFTIMCLMKNVHLGIRKMNSKSSTKTALQTVGQGMEGIRVAIEKAHGMCGVVFRPVASKLLNLCLDVMDNELLYSEACFICHSILKRLLSVESSGVLVKNGPLCYTVTKTEFNRLWGIVYKMLELPYTKGINVSSDQSRLNAAEILYLALEGVGFQLKLSSMNKLFDAFNDWLDPSKRNSRQNTHLLEESDKHILNLIIGFFENNEREMYPVISKYSRMLSKYFLGSAAKLSITSFIRRRALRAIQLQFRIDQSPYVSDDPKRLLPTNLYVISPAFTMDILENVAREFNYELSFAMDPKQREIDLADNGYHTYLHFVSDMVHYEILGGVLENFTKILKQLSDHANPNPIAMLQLLYTFLRYHPTMDIFEVAMCRKLVHVLHGHLESGDPTPTERRTQRDLRTYWALLCLIPLTFVSKRFVRDNEIMTSWAAIWGILCSNILPNSFRTHSTYAGRTQACLQLMIAIMNTSMVQSLDIYQTLDVIWGKAIYPVPKCDRTRICQLSSRAGKWGHPENGRNHNGSSNVTIAAATMHFLVHLLQQVDISENRLKSPQTEQPASAHDFDESEDTKGDKLVRIFSAKDSASNLYDDDPLYSDDTHVEIVQGRRQDLLHWVLRWTEFVAETQVEVAFLVDLSKLLVSLIVPGEPPGLSEMQPPQTLQSLCHIGPSKLVTPVNLVAGSANRVAENAIQNLSTQSVDLVQQFVKARSPGIPAAQITYVAGVLWSVFHENDEESLRFQGHILSGSIITAMKLNIELVDQNPCRSPTFVQLVANNPANLVATDIGHENRDSINKLLETIHEKVVKVVANHGRFICEDETNDCFPGPKRKKQRTLSTSSSDSEDLTFDDEIKPSSSYGQNGYGATENYVCMGTEEMGHFIKYSVRLLVVLSQQSKTAVLKSVFGVLLSGGMKKWNVVAVIVILQELSIFTQKYGRMDLKLFEKTLQYMWDTAHSFGSNRVILVQSVASLEQVTTIAVPTRKLFDKLTVDGYDNLLIDVNGNDTCVRKKFVVESGFPIPAKDRINIAKLVYNLRSIWSVAGLKDGVNFGDIVLFNAAHDNSSMPLREHSMEYTFQNPRTDPEYLEKLLHKHIDKFSAKGKTLMGVNRRLQHADGPEDCDFTEVDGISPQSLSLSMICQLEEEVRMNWKLLLSLACHFKQLLFPVLLRFCLFGRSGRNQMGETSSKYIQYRALRESFLKSAITRLASVNSYKSPLHMLFAYAGPIFASWIEYCPPDVDTNDILCHHKTLLENDTVHVNVISVFPFQLFGLHNFQEFWDLCGGYFLQILALRETLGTPQKRTRRSFLDERILAKLDSKEIKGIPDLYDRELVRVVSFVGIVASPACFDRWITKRKLKSSVDERLQSLGTQFAVEGLNAWFIGGFDNWSPPSSNQKLKWIEENIEPDSVNPVDVVLSLALQCEHGYVNPNDLLSVLKKLELITQSGKFGPLFWKAPVPSLIAHVALRGLLVRGENLTELVDVSCHLLRHLVSSRNSEESFLKSLLCLLQLVVFTVSKCAREFNDDSCKSNLMRTVKCWMSWAWGNRHIIGEDPARNTIKLIGNLPSEVVGQLGLGPITLDTRNGKDVCDVLPAIINGFELCTRMLPCCSSVYKPLSLHLLSTMSSMISSSVLKLLDQENLSSLTRVLFSFAKNEDSDIGTLTTNCLGQIGRFSPQKINFASPYDPTEMTESSAFLGIIEYLLNILAADDVGLSLCACATLEAMMWKPEAKELLPQETFRMLTNFLPTLSEKQLSGRSGKPLNGIVNYRLERALSRWFNEDFGQVKKVLHHDGSNCSYDDWVCKVTFCLLRYYAPEGSALGTCLWLCLIDPMFATLVFPVAVNSIFTRKDPEEVEGVKIVQQMFNMEMTRSSSSPNDTCVKICRTLFAALRFVRAEDLRRKLKVTKTRYVFPTGYIEDRLIAKCDLLVLAKTALNCGMPSTAVFYAEFWFNKPRQGQCLTMYRDIMLQAYSAIESPEEIQALRNNTDSLLTIASMEYTKGNWENALSGLDALLFQRQSQGSQPVQSMFCNTLRNLGFNHLLDTVVNVGGVEGAEMKYEVGWRFLSRVKETRISSSFDCVLYQGLLALIDGDQSQFEFVRKLGREGLLAQLSLQVSSEEYTTSKLSRIMGKMQSLKELDVFWKRRWNRSPRLNGLAERMGREVREWDLNIEEVRDLGFEDARTIVEFRTSLLKAFGLTLPENEQFCLKTEIGSHGVFITRLARRQGEALLARNLLNEFSCPEIPPRVLKKEQAEVLAVCSEYDGALRILRNEIEEIKSILGGSGPKIELGELLFRAGQILLKNGIESYQNVEEFYMEPSLKICEGNLEDPGLYMLAGKCHLELATYADKLFRAIQTRMNSPEWKKVRLFQEKRAEKYRVWSARTKQNKDRQLRHALKSLMRMVDRDNAQYELEMNTRETLLKNSVNHYGKALALNSHTDLASLFRLISLWFENCDVVRPEDMFLDEIPTFKFIELKYQLVSRLGSKEGSSQFCEDLERFIRTLTKDHPFHMLPIIFPLTMQKEGTSKTHKEDTTKGDAARRIVSTLKKCKGSKQVEAIDAVMRAFVALSSFQRPVRGGAALSNSTQACTDFVAFWGKAKHTMTQTPMLTCKIPLREDCDYNSTAGGKIVWLKDIRNTYTNFTSGLARPKIVTCVSTAGQEIRMLAKAGDDLRQDAIMQQLYGVVDKFLASGKSKMSLRTYTVVPLTHDTGLVGFIERTSTLGSYLADAHERYKTPKGISCRRALTKMRDLATTKDKKLKTPENLLKLYQGICKAIKPVFRHFFLEKYLRPSVWLSKRTKYAQSAAVTSIVGYIMGVGDRHLENIMIDESSAELIHIDFGFVFDSGKLLPTPERVPFRLTRDMVDGMGVNGSSGIFQHSCEETLSILRKNRDSLLSICQVFVHDPLHSWNISLEDLQKKQGGDDDESPVAENHGTRGDALFTDLSTRDGSGESTQEVDSKGGQTEAETLVLRVQQKLEGREDPSGEALSVKAHVQRLVAQAKDERNLCRMYYGWKAFL